jgi:hypothetical protein
MLTVATAPGPRTGLVPVAPHGRGARNTRMLIPRLSAVTVAVVTGTEGPSQTHIPPDSELGTRATKSATSTRQTCTYATSRCCGASEADSIRVS